MGHQDLYLQWQRKEKGVLKASVLMMKWSSTWCSVILINESFYNQFNTHEGYFPVCK